MSPDTAGWLLLLLFGVCLNEASSFKLKFASREEIMTNMTTEAAVKMVMGMRRTHDHGQLAALIQEKLGHMLSRHQGKSQLRTALRHRQGPGEPSGYAALENAKNMLNGMLEEANMKLELEDIKCKAFDRKQLLLMEETEQDVASFNGLAAESRGHVLKAQGAIMLCNGKIPDLHAELEDILRQCTHDVGSLKASLNIVLEDIDVMGKVLELTDCRDASVAPALIQCPHCKGADGDGMVMIQEDTVQPLLGRLRSAVARQYLQQNLARSYHEAVAQAGPVMLTQKAVTHAIDVLRKSYYGSRQADLLRAIHGVRHREIQLPLLDPNTVNTSDVLVAPQLHDCIPNTKCTLGETPDCARLRDRFLVIQAGIRDKKDELSRELVETEDYCEKTQVSYGSQISQLEYKLREEQTNLAMGTKDQVDAESQSHVKSAQHSQLLKEYEDTMKSCCDNQNELKSEACALEKIRGELFKMEGQDFFITDCQVSDWKPEVCSASCGGGTQIKTRSVIVHPVGGTACLPLQMQEACNEQACPVDCEVEDWAGWSGCTADCGGGVRMRTRAVKVDMQHGGQPCGATEEEEPCNLQACDHDCTLGDWGAWGACSKACGGGSYRRQRGVQEPAKGTGTCFEPESAQRLQFTPCNEHSCEAMLAPLGRTTLMCNSKVDVVLVVDGSGSLGSFGWKQTKNVSSMLIEALMGGNSSVNVALQLFGGPSTAEAYDKCTSSVPGVVVDLRLDCGITWVQHFTTSKSAALAAVNGMLWPASTTLTSVALAEASSELSYGRADANAVVICVTDGKPMSGEQTKEAAQRLRQKARVVWVPVGSAAPLDLIREMASKPEADHMVVASTFSQLTLATTINKIIADACPLVL